MVLSKDLAVGIDIGGTNIKLGLVNKQREIIKFQSISLKRNSDNSADIKHICQSLKRFIDNQQVCDRLVGVGVACPGILDTDQGIVHCAVNLGWNHIPLVERMQDLLQLPVHLESDSVAGAIGEEDAAAAGMSSYLYVCIGTGVGASLFINEDFYRGENGKAIDIGHFGVIPDGKLCNCGNQGCLERYVSGPALCEQARNGMKKKDTQLSQYVRAEEKLEAFHIYKAAKKGDEYCLQLFREAGQLLGIAFVNCVHLFGVRNIIIGGGVSQAGTFLLDPIRKVSETRLGKQNVGINIIQASMPTKSGVLGVAKQIFHYSSVL